MTATAGRNEGTLDALLRGYRFTQMVHVAAKLGVADHLVDRPRTAGELAAAVGANADALYRLLRALAAIGIFDLDAEGRFSLTEEGSLLRSDVADSWRVRAITYGEPWWWQAWGGLFEAVRTGGPAFDAVHGVDLFGFLAKDSEASGLFNGIMHSMTTAQAEMVAARYDFSATRRLVDIGGGHGALAAAILRVNPEATAVLFDRPSVIEGASARLAGLDVGSRCTLVGGDFFASVPDGADTYTLKDIIHDWDDERACLIFRNVRRAMPKTARLLLVERVIPPGNAPSPGKFVDISMLVLTGGRERTEGEYRALLEKTGFAIRRVLPIDGETSVIEAEPQ